MVFNSNGSKAWTVNRYNQTGKRSLRVLEESVAKVLGRRGASLGLDRQDIFQRIPYARALHRSSDVLVGNTVVDYSSRSDSGANVG